MKVNGPGAQIASEQVPTIVSVTNLKVSFPTDTGVLTVLDIPSWRVEQGAQVAVSGPSGSGKSTFLNVLAGLIRPDHGSVAVCGVELSDLGETGRDRFRARHIGYIHQDFNLLPGYTALENVLLGMSFSRHRPDRGRARALLGDMGLGHRLDHYPSRMSVGEQQRAAIARALAKAPELILADEPTGSLDPRRTAEVLSLLGSSCREHGCTLILVSHEAGVASLFDGWIDFRVLNRADLSVGGSET